MKYTIYNELGEWWTGKKWGELADRLIYLSRDYLPSEVGDLFYGMPSEGPLEHLYFCVDECAPGGRSPRAWVLEHPADGRTLPGVSKEEVFDIRKTWHTHKDNYVQKTYEWSTNKDDGSYRFQVLVGLIEDSSDTLCDLRKEFETDLYWIDQKVFSYSSEKEQGILKELLVILENQANKVREKLDSFKELEDTSIYGSINKTKSDPYEMIRRMSEEDRLEVFEFAMKRSRDLMAGKD